ncbi:VOC family protein [Devosia sp.]|uniref:VOC family protein n=1 Tax=Devosia sp. TaxID=1871048 RepID=UPI00326492DE
MPTLNKVIAFAPTTDAGRAPDFYQRILGLTLVEQNGFALVFDVGGVMLRVTIVGELTPRPFTVLGWVVGDIEASIDALVDRGVVFLDYGMGQDRRKIWTAPSGGRIAWFQDPDGNVLSLTG